MDIVAGEAGATREGCPVCKEDETLSGQFDTGERPGEFHAVIAAP